MAAAVGVSAAAYSNPGAIQIPVPPGTEGIANPYPSPITVAGGPTSITKTVVVLSGFSHTYVGDVDMMLAAPGTGATNAIFFADACQNAANNTPNFTNRTMTMDDTAATSLPTVCPNSGNELPSGTYHPTNNDGTGDLLLSPAPTPTGLVNLATFNGLNSNGTWNLWINDDVGGDVGQLANGWSLNFNGQGATAVGVRNFSAARDSRSVVVTWSTGSEADVAGFNLYRATERTVMKVNRLLIPAKRSGRSIGASYRFVDRGASRDRSWTYRLRVVKLDGTTSLYSGTSSVSLAP